MTHVDLDQNQTPDQGPVALRILQDILRGTSSTAQLTSRYGISAFALKRHLCELRHLGVEFSHYEVNGQGLWRCRNQDLIQSSALFRMWLAQGEGRLKENDRAA